LNSYIIASTKKSSGKTIISIGISAVLKSMNKNISVFKKGPDYIDPIWLSLASKTSCYNLDFYTMTKSEIKKLFLSKSSTSEVAIVEANKGLFDGLSLDGSDSNAALAKFLNLNVILVLDCSGTTRGIVPLIKGYKSFDNKVKYKGLILNNINGTRHEDKILKAINFYTDFKVIGSVWKNTKLKISEQHLGLQPVFVEKNYNKIIKDIRSVIKSSVDIHSLCNTHKIKEKKSIIKTKQSLKYSHLSIGIARDEAFGFYYLDDLEALINSGIKIKYFNTLKDSKVPNVDAIFIGGGFPELVASKLSKNIKMMQSIKNFIELDKPAYAECGGLMYLSKAIKFKSKVYKMSGVIDGIISVKQKPVGRGYVNLEATNKHPWMQKSKSIFCHEFHYSDISLVKNKYKFAYKILRGYGIDQKHDGILYKNLLASYSHIRDTKQSRWIENFLTFIDKKYYETKTNI
jgi:cobyrinic acid a,c-diamide synthase